MPKRRRYWTKERARRKKELEHGPARAYYEQTGMLPPKHPFSTDSVSAMLCYRIVSKSCPAGCSS